jgi:serine/threonine-protein kinase RsbW
MAKIRLPAEIENLEELLDFVVKEAVQAGFSARRVSEVRLAAEEVLVNIFCYAYPETDGDVSISCFVKEGFFVLEILDSGTPFNIMAAPGPDLSSCLSERYVGGLGIHFVKEMATEARYVRENGQNRLTLVFGKSRQE